MYRVIIVDDEPIAIDAVEYIIKNNLENLEVGGKARSGREAIEKAYQAVGRIKWAGAHYRHDIGKKALKYI